MARPYPERGEAPAGQSRAQNYRTVPGPQFWNDPGRPALAYLEPLQFSRRDTPMNTLPVDRALSIYETLADRLGV